MNLSSEMVQIEEIRQQVNQLQQINQLLLPLIRQYEIVMDSDERVTIQHQITNTIQKGNSIAASSRVFYFLMKICSFQFKHSNWNSTLLLMINILQHFISNIKIFLLHRVFYHNHIIQSHIHSSKTLQLIRNYNNNIQNYLNRIIHYLLFSMNHQHHQHQLKKRNRLYYYKLHSI